MHIKIFFEDKPLYLCNEIDETIEPIIHHDDALFMDQLDSHAIKTIIHEIQQPHVHAGVFFHSDLEELKKAFWKKFNVIVAAGGLIKNEKQEILMIFRRGKWDLPKGKLDKGEKSETCVVREVEEETGLNNAKVIAQLLTTQHTYHEGTKFILKETHWFSMQADSEQKLTPQMEEGITEIKWVKENDLNKYLTNSYALISDVIAAQLKK